MKESTATFDPVAESVRRARRFVTDALEEWGSDAVDDAALLVSELATNAVIHAGTAYTVTVAMIIDVIRVGVADESPAKARRSHYGEMAATGRGLGMVADVSSRWGIDISDSGKIVWFELAARKGDADAATTATNRVVDVDVDLDAVLAELGGWNDIADDPDTAKGRRPAGVRA